MLSLHMKFNTLSSQKTISKEVSSDVFSLKQVSSLTLFFSSQVNLTNPKRDSILGLKSIAHPLKIEQTTAYQQEQLIKLRQLIKIT